MNKIMVVRPAGKENENYLEQNLQGFLDQGLEVEYEELPFSEWPYASSTPENRFEQLKNALLGSFDAIICARGGYGASDLLDFLTPDLVQSAKNLSFTGFSDISALHSYIYKHANLSNQNLKLIHGPMPSTALWDFNSKDVKLLLDCIFVGRPPKEVELTLTQLTCGISEKKIAGKLFGGCFSVLTNLIGTNHLPDLNGHILFFEDIGEHPARIMRYFNQWIQSGILKDAKAIVMGYFKGLGEGIEDNSEMFLKEFSKRSPIPVWHTKEFGHISDNCPLPIGEIASISNNKLIYNL